MRGSPKESTINIYMLNISNIVFFVLIKRCDLPNHRYPSTIVESKREEEGKEVLPVVMTILPPVMRTERRRQKSSTIGYYSL